MAESGWYPPGAEHDPRAPWNQPDEDDGCPDCRRLEEPCARHEEVDGPDPDLVYEQERDERLLRETEAD